ncbi:MAG: cytochrome c-type biosis protein [Frankiales bacterium]|nr:cytochrome c-type biosis protein [Frankiales bacterium]
MVLASVADTFRNTVADGSLVLAIPVAFAAGLVSFLSPCVLPLVPGYLSYVTGLSGADLAGEQRPEGPGAMTATALPPASAHRGRVLAGSVLFICGFSAVFVSLGVLFGDLGRQLTIHAVVISRVLGGFVIVLGLVFLGVIPGMQREYRLHRLPAAGLVGAFPLGFVFGLGWTPCLGPTLTAVQALAFQGGTASRGALLSFFYCLGLGLPFIVAALAFRRAMSAFAILRRHTVLIMRIGGLLLITVGVLLVTGQWNDFTIWLRTHVSPGYTPAV